MVVLAASITTSNGKPLLSRQFKDLSRDRVLELLSNFQNLVSLKHSSNHTFVEDDHVRYVYKPFDDFYIILITNRQSNIVQDLSTLNLFSQTINAFLNNQFDQYEIYNKAFEILSSFDEIVSMGGYKEHLSLNQVNTYIAMESHEEKIQEIIERNKEIEATEERKRRAKEIARKEQERKNGMIYPSGNDFTAGANASNLNNAYNSYYSHASPAAQQSYLKQQQQQQHHHQQLPQSIPNSGPRAGMKLSGLGNNSNINAKRLNTSRVQTSSPSINNILEQDEKPIENNGILIQINETVNSEINRDGTVQSSELKGSLELRINDPELAHATIKLADSMNVKDRTFQFKTHPNIDKNSFLNNKIISLRDKSKSFPSNDHSLGVLRWRKIGSAGDKSLIPLEVSTWVTENSSNKFDVTVEFELNNDLEEKLDSIANLYFTIPVANGSISINEDSNDFSASIVNVDDEFGTTIKVESSLERGQSGLISFSVNADGEDSLFPINVSYKNYNIKENKSISGVAIEDIVNNEDSAFPYDSVANLTTEEYIIV
ncbi:hypothetical protein KAFR_0J00130 [Kazachstania africana CBS 2517]|uniref:Coatomer subunit delta n=1 Tax=Kazachstania africana (strain ATCC 22294 / BCRC 22015 / CBS 2517 / CECT 1963 / NBRC 1671 / NRRL Y-8276) TaxID=1071382 RepID=H2B0D1_KAZAF|nr:hypothetical protein KAFR_0J00130 [Kazachstania africana CBS 2517]CCF60081.1 hypothetical protein KAFR_0J00130 [Kazachstania africana CBS 2517]